MHIIPVIDIRHRIAVRAVAGDRAGYRPLETPLVDAGGAVPWGQTHGSDPATTGPPPEAIARAYRSLYPFATIYVADLDGIEGRGADAGLAGSLVAALPEVEFWIDAGGGTPSAATASEAVNVVGSEVLGERDLAQPFPAWTVLSLDFRGEALLGPPALLQRADLWPTRVIVMTLARVGTDSGPDIARVAAIARRAPQARIYAAGGIRDVADLRALRAVGAHGALVASALHAQKIKADDLAEIIGL
jgi:uncharacterized protein related to proFAR isomerase